MKKMDVNDAELEKNKPNLPQIGSKSQSETLFHRINNFTQTYPDIIRQTKM